MQFEVRKVALKQDKTGYILTLSMHPDEIPEELLRDFVGSRYACALVRINDDETPVITNDRVKRAGILCRYESFQQFLGVEGEQAAAEAVCKTCGIESRTALNGNVKARDIFDALVADYERGNDDPF
jgi:hypothetical protein